MWFDGSEPETCKRCGFDSWLWTRQDASTVLQQLGSWWSSATADVTVDDLNHRPAPGVWSALEYGLHSAFVLPILRYGIELMLAADGRDVHDPWADLDIEDASRPQTLDPRTVVDSLEREGQVFAEFVDHHHGGWDHAGRMEDGRWWQAEATLMHVLHDTTHHFLDVGEGLVRVGASLPTAKAAVDAVGPCGSISLGVPVSKGRAPTEGSDRLRPYEAVRLSPANVGLVQRSGAGEHLVLAGVDWPRLRAGTRLLVGSALVELSYPAARDIGATTWYGWVRQAGYVCAGDKVVVSPT